MKIGGVKEKILGARRDGVFNLIFPYENKREVMELEPEVKEGVNIVFVNHYFEVMKEVFGIDLNQPLEAETAT
jgi:ATP-dependent Lon protease